MLSMAQIKKPKLLVFDLAYTLCPFWVDEIKVTPPLKKGNHDCIVDAAGKKLIYYPDVPEIFKNLKKNEYKIAIASKTKRPQLANKILELFDWDKYIDYKEIRKGSKLIHFENIKNASGINYDEMIFFDDEERNIIEINKLGVLSILVDNGIEEFIVNNALDKYANQ